MPRKIDTNATHLLAHDHRLVEKLFAQYEKADDRMKKADLAQQICNELKIHAMIEEEVFYPALRGKVEDDLLDEAYVEHDSAKILINEIADGSPDEEFYDAKILVLKEQIEHHVKEEEKERDNMFQQARASGVDLDALGEKMLARKKELEKLAQSADLPKAKPVTVSLM